ncbi:Hypothetical predicted protein [Octopus vulgaris]|uniref:Uncharacterized protein n=1 Tax=Octopus vulgaris TaxID=6645 RepID=A0AA36AJA9_OCTVU|nr:Hypothetical predicted protein [Octopus vulgaris]
MVEELTFDKDSDRDRSSTFDSDRGRSSTLVAVNSDFMIFLYNSIQYSEFVIFQTFDILILFLANYVAAAADSGSSSSSGDDNDNDDGKLEIS